jgi:hypothetical protein
MERGFPVELLYVVGFVVFVLFNYLLQKAARRRQEAQAEAEAAQSPRPPADEPPLEEIWGRSAAAPPVQVPASVPRLAPAPRAEPVPVRRMHPVRALLRDKRDLRRAVILMMVLGPCRSQEPPDDRL